MTGSELMTGVTVDSNSAFIAQCLLEIGIAVQKKVTLGDDLSQLTYEVQQLTDADILIINGGLGPTIDDLTAEVLAQATQTDLRCQHEAERHIQQWCQQRGFEANDANLKQALLPERADIIANPIGSAVGIALQHNGCLILATPGVPSEMHRMLKEQIMPLLQARFPNIERQTIKRLQVFGWGESAIQQQISQQFTPGSSTNNEKQCWPKEVELGFRAGAPTLELKLTIQSKQYLAEQERAETMLKTLLGSHCFGEENDSLASVLIDILKAKGQRIALAESCTGGLMASMLTRISGASQVFELGQVTYSNRIKQQQLHVSSQTLEQYGAVSEACVKEMLQGLLEQSTADYGVAVSGIAGPDGGNDDKPVGSVCFAWGSAHEMKSHSLIYPAKREHFQIMAAAYGLDLIRRFILGIDDQPRYFK